MDCADVIVVGSGASGVHATFPLVESGFRVTMIDVGMEERGDAPAIPSLSFPDVRRLDAQQHRYFMGDDFSGIPVEPAGAGPQITYPRRHVIQRPRRAPETRTRGVFALESFAAGGLAEAWGAVSFDYLDGELERSGLSPAAMRPHYEIVAKRIGISAAQDDLASLRGGLDAIQPVLRADANATSLLRKYQQRRQQFADHGVYVGRPMLAVLSEGIDGRSANPYHDMDYWSNEGDSIYRPAVTLRTLRRRANFDYQQGWIVQAFVEDGNGTVIVHAQHSATGAHKEFVARRLVLAAGALGTTRIVLRSLGRYDVPVPLVCNAHTYVPCLNVSRVVHDEQRHSLAQLTMIYDPTRDGAHLVQAQMYSYGSLLLFRLMAQWPLGHREGLRLLRDVAPNLVIWVVQHEDAPRPDSVCRLRRQGDEEWLDIEYRSDSGFDLRRRQHERVMMRWMRRCGCWPLKAMRMGHGSSVHYGGQLPTTSDERPLTTDQSGRLRETLRVFIADGAALAYLPAKGPTFTLMANANRVGTVVGQSLQ